MSTELEPIPTKLGEISMLRFCSRKGVALRMGQTQDHCFGTDHICVTADDARILAKFLLDFADHPMNMEEKPYLWTTPNK